MPAQNYCKKIIELGEYVHLLARQGKIADPFILALVEEIREIDKNEYIMLEGMPVTEDTARCPSCRSPIGSNDNYCGHCGFAIKEYFEHHAPCPACGGMKKKEDVFCPICGTTEEVFDEMSEL